MVDSELGFHKIIGGTRVDESLNVFGVLEI